MALTGPAELLATWERGLGLSEPDRAWELHRAARPGVEADELSLTPVGVREAELHALRRALFGDRLDALAECVACDEVMEFEFDAATLAAGLPGGSEGIGSSEGVGGSEGIGSSEGVGWSGGGALRLAEDGWDVEFRLPTVADLTLTSAGDPAGALRRLLGRCVLTVIRGGRARDVDDLPDQIVGRLAEEAQRADPLSAVTLRVTCPACGAVTPADLDAAAYLWAELDSWARDLLVDIHLLARAYGWTEPQVLALSPLRRRYYLELCVDA